MTVPRASGTSLKLFLALAVAAGVLLAAIPAVLASPAAVKPGVVAQAKAWVVGARKPITRFNGPATSPGPVPKGKKIALIDIIPAPFINNIHAGVVAAAKTVGWTVRPFNAKGTPQGMSQAMASALAIKPDAIISNVLPIAFLQPQLKQAKAAGIPVIALIPGLPLGPYNPAKWTVTNTVDTDYTQQAKNLAYWVIQDSPKGASAIALTSPEYQDFNAISGLFQSILKGAGSSFTIATTVPSPVADLAGGPTAISRLSSPMRKYKQAKYMYALSESWFSLFLQAQQQAGRDDVTALGTDGDVSIPLVKQGKKLVMTGTDSVALGWTAVDATIRAFNHKPQIHYSIPLRLVDKVNAGSIKTPGIVFNYDYKAKWKALWGLK
jgi:ribose transport system substrate-binding protein